MRLLFLLSLSIPCLAESAHDIFDINDLFEDSPGKCSSYVKFHMSFSHDSVLLDGLCQECTHIGSVMVECRFNQGLPDGLYALRAAKDERPMIKGKWDNGIRVGIWYVQSNKLPNNAGYIASFDDVSHRMTQIFIGSLDKTVDTKDISDDKDALKIAVDEMNIMGFFKISCDIRAGGLSLFPDWPVPISLPKQYNLGDSGIPVGDGTRK